MIPGNREALKRAEETVEEEVLTIIAEHARRVNPYNRVVNGRDLSAHEANSPNAPRSRHRDASMRVPYQI